MKKTILVLLCVITTIILTSCINFGDSANTEIMLGYAEELVLAINNYNIAHPDFLIDENDLNYETLYAILDKDSIWLEESEDYNWQLVINLIYFEDGVARLKKAQSCF